MGSSCVISQSLPIYHRRHSRDAAAHGILHSPALPNISKHTVCVEIGGSMPSDNSTCLDECIRENIPDIMSLCVESTERHATDEVGMLQPPAALTRHETDFEKNEEYRTPFGENSQTACEKLNSKANDKEIWKLEPVWDKHAQDEGIDNIVRIQQCNFHHDFIKLTTLDPNHTSLKNAGSIVSSKGGGEGQASLVINGLESQFDSVVIRDEFEQILLASLEKRLQRTRMCQSGLKVGENKMTSYQDPSCSNDERVKEHDLASRKNGNAREIVSVTVQSEKMDLDKLLSSKWLREDTTALGLKKGTISSRWPCMTLTNLQLPGLGPCRAHPSKSLVWYS